jgi:hypothetical protein
MGALEQESSGSSTSGPHQNRAAVLKLGFGKRYELAEFRKARREKRFDHVHEQFVADYCA